MLSNELNIDVLKVAQVAGTDAITSDVINAANYDGIMFLTSIPTKGVEGSANSVKVQQCATEDGEFADVAGSSVNISANNQVVLIDVFKPLQANGGYFKVVVTRGTSTATGDIYAVLYNGRKRPEVNSFATQLISPEVSA